MNCNVPPRLRRSTIGRLVALFVLVVTTGGWANPITTTFEGSTATGGTTYDGGWFTFNLQDVTVTVTAVIAAADLPAAHVHYRVFLTEVDPGPDEDLGSKLICVPPGSWTLRADGKYQATLSYTFPKISTYYGDDWGASAANEDPSCGGISTSFFQPTEFDPLLQAITLDVGNFPVTDFVYGQFQSHFVNPLAPGSTHVLYYPAQTGTLPYSISYIGHPNDVGALTGLNVPEPSTLLSFITGAVGFLGYIRRRRNPPVD